MFVVGDWGSCMFVFFVFSYLLRMKVRKKDLKSATSKCRFRFWLREGEGGRVNQWAELRECGGHPVSHTSSTDNRNYYDWGWRLNT